MLRLPDFIGVGPGRSGTTWLNAVLEGHVGLPVVKETEFFGRYYDKGIEWYAWHFRHCPPGLPMGELTAGFRNEEIGERIKRHIPNCKILCTLRDPVELGYSVYKMMRHYTFLREVSFEDAIRTDWRVMGGPGYPAHLRRWQSLFGEDRVLVTLYDDLRADNQAFLDRVCDFIGIGRIALEGVTVNTRARNSYSRAPRNLRLARKARRLMWRLRARRMYGTVDLLERAGFWDFCFGRGEEFPPLDPALDARLREQLRPDIEELERMIGRDLSAWKSGRRETARDGARTNVASSPLEQTIRGGRLGASAR